MQNYFLFSSEELKMLFEYNLCCAGRAGRRARLRRRRRLKDKQKSMWKRQNMAKRMAVWAKKGTRTDDGATSFCQKYYGFPQNKVGSRSARSLISNHLLPKLDTYQQSFSTLLIVEYLHFKPLYRIRYTELETEKGREGGRGSPD